MRLSRRLAAAAKPNLQTAVISNARSKKFRHGFRRGLIGDFVKSYRVPRFYAVAAEPDDVARRIAQANRIWNTAQQPRGTPAAAYFVDRGLDITLLHSLRYAASLRRSDGTYGPAVIARVDDVEGRLVAIHRTWIGLDDG